MTTRIVVAATVLVILVVLLVGLAIGPRWNPFYRPPTPAQVALSSPAGVRTVPVTASGPVRLVYAGLGNDLTNPQKAAAVDGALRDMIQWLRGGREGAVEALILTVSASAPGVDATSTTKLLSDTLKDVPAGTPIFVVPGGRRLAASETLAAALKADADVILELQKQLQSNPTGPRVVTDLSECYRNPAADGAGCVVRLPGRPVRLVGYPAYLMPAVAPGATANEALIKEQDQWRAIFAKAMALAGGTKALLVSPLSAPVAGHWVGANQAGWMAIARSAGSAIGIDVAGTRRRAAYETGEPWTEPGLQGRWLLVPPLLAPDVTDDEAAQGASLLTVLADGSVSREMFWYDPPALAFRSAATTAPTAPARTGLIERAVAGVSYLWSLGSTLRPIDRASMFCIALLAAFLTVAAVWQIPPAFSGNVTITTPAAPGTQQQATTIAIPQALMDKWAPASLLQQNLARTVLSGLGGLAVATLTLDTVGQDNKSDAQAYYLVWFILWFLLFLLTSSMIRGVVEGIRALAYVGRQQHLPSATGKSLGFGWSLRALVPSLSRIYWFMIVANDAFFNLIQGKNELKNTIWAGEILSLHEDAVLAIDRIAEHLRAGLLQYFAAHPIPPDPPAPGAVPPAPAAGPVVPELADIRVAVSLLSDDGKSVYYVSWPIESSAKEFGPNSVAYIAVAGTATRWWIEGMPDTVNLFDNSAGYLEHLPKQKLMLKEHFASRGRDYKSFVVFPIPSRPGDGVGRRAGLHISFKYQNALSTVWSGTVAAPPDCFVNDGNILDNTPKELERLLRQSIHVIESVLRSFNEGVFKQAMRSRRRA